MSTAKRMYFQIANHNNRKNSNQNDNRRFKPQCIIPFICDPKHTKKQLFVKKAQTPEWCLTIHSHTLCLYLTHATHTHTQPDRGANNKKHLFTRRLTITANWRAQWKLESIHRPDTIDLLAREKVFLHIYTTTGVNIGLECVQLNEWTSTLYLCNNNIRAISLWYILKNSCMNDYNLFQKRNNLWVLLQSNGEYDATVMATTTPPAATKNKNELVSNENQCWYSANKHRRLSKINAPARSRTQTYSHTKTHREITVLRPHEIIGKIFGSSI